jgi:TonB family protein
LNAVTYFAAAVVLVIVGMLVVPRLLRNGSITSEKGNLQTESTAEEQPTATAQAPGRPNSGIAAVSDQGASAEVLKETNSPAGRERPEGLSGARGRAPRQGLTAGQVAEQVLPDVPRSALDTIHGTVRVGVRISVDSAGNVTEAELDSPGPSKYFAQLALEAAQQWKFEPPRLEGRNVLSDWLLHFQFTQSGTKVIPVQSDP